MSAYRVGGPESRRIAVLFHDITEIKRAEQRLRDTQKLETLGVLASGIAHDFNNMLGGILAQSELALAEVPADSPLAEGVNTIKTVALHAAETVRQLLAYAGRRAPVSSWSTSHGSWVRCFSCSRYRFQNTRR